MIELQKSNVSVTSSGVMLLALDPPLPSVMTELSQYSSRKHTHIYIQIKGSTILDSLYVIVLHTSLVPVE